MMKILLNPKYKYLEAYISSIPIRFDLEGEKIYESRNVVKVMSVNGFLVNVKRYGIPLFINRIVYSFFRKPKGIRAFYYPEILLGKGIQTPEPIAYIEKKTCGLLGYSFFISVQCPYRYNFYEFGDADIKDCGDVITAFARFTARLHEAGILHRDYSPGNVLFDKVESQYQFSIVDINRMSFGNVSVKRGCASFSRFWGQRPMFELLAKEYALARGADVDKCIEWVMTSRKKFWSKYMKKHEVRFKLDL